MTDKVAVVFGGTGFIGSYLADLLLRDRGFSKVFLVDLQAIEEKPFAFRKELVRRHGAAIQYIRADVRSPIDWFPEEKVHLVANFAAVHREPGHEDFEYFETNLSGARHVCAWAEKVGCAEVIFTSSISPYGVSEAEKDERTMTVPVTAYGSSKLAAEEIHRTWQAADPLGRVLTIVRPGVVFGAGEGGNVSRLVRAVSSGYFLYMGNRGTRKAGIYVKELCEAMLWVLDRQRTTSTPVALFNASMNPGPSISEYVDAVVRVSGRRAVVPNVPYRLLLAVSHVIDAVAKPLRIAHPFSPVRVRKLVRSNNVLPRYLSENGYVYRYTLDSAMQDWRSECPAEWR